MGQAGNGAQLHTPPLLMYVPDLVLEVSPAGGSPINALVRVMASDVRWQVDSKAQALCNP